MRVSCWRCCAPRSARSTRSDRARDPDCTPRCASVELPPLRGASISLSQQLLFAIAPKLDRLTLRPVPSPDRQPHLPPHLIAAERALKELAPGGPAAAGLLSDEDDDDDEEEDLPAMVYGEFEQLLITLAVYALPTPHMPLLDKIRRFFDPFCSRVAADLKRLTKNFAA